MGQLEESASYLDRALRVAQEQSDLEVQGWTHGHYVWLARYTGQTETALAHATQAHEIADRIGSAFSRVWSLCYLGYAHFMLGEIDEAIAAFERSLELAREARTGLQPEAWLVAGLSEVLLSAGDQGGALEASEESVTLALKRGTQMYLPNCYRVLAEAQLASDDQRRIAAAQDALDEAAAAVEVTGARAELPFIESAQEKLITLS
jgi:tetratricopeptide (TPR) repeat protein